jgi:hypothetical protein
VATANLWIGSDGDLQAGCSSSNYLGQVVATKGTTSCMVRQVK